MVSKLTRVRGSVLSTWGCSGCPQTSPACRCNETTRPVPHLALPPTQDSALCRRYSGFPGGSRGWLSLAHTCGWSAAQNCLPFASMRMAASLGWIHAAHQPAASAELGTQAPGELCPPGAQPVLLMTLLQRADSQPLLTRLPPCPHGHHSDDGQSSRAVPQHQLVSRNRPCPSPRRWAPQGEVPTVTIMFYFGNTNTSETDRHGQDVFNVGSEHTGISVYSEYCNEHDFEVDMVGEESFRVAVGGHSGWAESPSF